MKKLLVALMLVCGVAHAEEWLEMPNEAGGKILLLTLECKSKETGKPDGRQVVTSSPNGTGARGCWFYYADMIHIMWNDGDSSVFEPNQFTAKNNDKRKVKKK